jgi:acyl-coenzyme A thioesterase PaaI-like protein
MPFTSGTPSSTPFSIASGKPALITAADQNQFENLLAVRVGNQVERTRDVRQFGNPDRRYTHGGVLAALVDLGADWAMVKTLGLGVPTIDLRVDYHSPPCRAT